MLIFGECGVPFHSHCSFGSLWLRVVASDGSNRTNFVCKQMMNVNLWLLYSNTWNHSTVCKKNVMYKMCLEIIYVFDIDMYKQDLALNDLQWLICHKTQPNRIKLYKNSYVNIYNYSHIFIYESIIFLHIFRVFILCTYIFRGILYITYIISRLQSSI